MSEQIQLLRDASVQPTNEVIAEALGSANSVYIQFVEELKKYDIEAIWRYYTDGTAWLCKGLYKWETKRGTKKETTAFWLAVWSGFFKITIYIPEKHRADALNLPLSSEVIRMIKTAQQIGKLKFFPLSFDVYTDELFSDILTLANFRKALK